MNVHENERVLVVEDDSSLSDLLAEELEAAAYEVKQASSVEEAGPVVREWRPSLVVSDLRLPGADGLSLLSTVHTDERAGEIPPAFLMITAFGTIGQAVEALKAGADEFLTKPLEMDHFLLTVERLLENRRLRSEVRHYRALMAEDEFHGILGRSRPMRSLYEQIRQIGAADGPVLILGESGVGKELVAKAVHAESTRAQEPFLAVNCAGIPSELMESEFFGHAAGAFTGARHSREGLLAQADGGALLLDEIAEMPLSLQAKLLRALQDGSIRPVGGNEERKVDVRIIAATHRDLQEKCRDGGFREDLYFRLETFTLRVPPLRERGEDIELLAEHLLNQNRQKKQRPVRGFSREAMALLQRYPFPGNVRELQNAVERAVAFCDQDLIGVEHLPQRMLLRATGSDGLTREQSGGAHQAAVEPAAIGADEWLHLPEEQEDLPRLETVQRGYVQHVLDRTGGNKRRTAAILGVTRRTLYRWLEGREKVNGDKVNGEKVSRENDSGGKDSTRGRGRDDSAEGRSQAEGTGRDSLEQIGGNKAGD